MTTGTDDENIVWGNLDDNIVWGNGCSWSAAADDNIVWGNAIQTILGGDR